MEKPSINENQMVCCQKKEEILNKLSIQGTPVVESVTEWIKWTTHKSICQECKIFRADSLNMMSKSATEADKDAYLKKYFTV